MGWRQPPGAIIINMKPETIQQLLDLNASFYQTFAVEFSATRQRLQPGVERVVREYGVKPGEPAPNPARWLDLGCGNGELALRLGQLGFTGVYLGLDFSPPLLELAREASRRIPDGSIRARIEFREADLGRADLDGILHGERPFDAILAFAVLHHLPGRERRLNLFRRAREHLAPGGVFIHSVWQFQNSPRWQKRVVPWNHAGVEEHDLEPGDTLLDWRATGDRLAPGLRYVHRFSEEELAVDAAASGFSIRETFYSDGREGNLGLYQVWSPMVLPSGWPSGAS